MYILSAPLKNIVLKKRNLASLAMALVTTLQAQPGISTWKDLGVKWPKDDTWGKGTIVGKSPSRMQVDARGNLFVSQGDSLYIGTSSGTIWKAAPIVLKSFIEHTPVAVGLGGSVIWGSWRSTDWGATWKNRALMNSFQANAISPAGYCLFGGPYQQIARSSAPGEQPTDVYYGGATVAFIDFAFGAKGMVYASSKSTNRALDMMISRDSGKANTWVRKATLFKSDPVAPELGDLLPGLLALEAGHPEESLWMASGAFRIKNSTGMEEKNQTVEYFWIGDSLSAWYPANVGIPDSSITSLRVQTQGTTTVLWMGTWGQGVYRSADRGKTWQSLNAGLTDLHIEAMAVGPAGLIYSLTPQGLFLIGEAQTLITPRKGQRSDLSYGRAYSDRALGPALRFGDATGLFFQADGRCSLPASFMGGRK